MARDSQARRRIPGLARSVTGPANAEPYADWAERYRAIWDNAWIASRRIYRN